MALRENECFLVRRVAARGIDKSIGGSRVGGKDRVSICRVADRGSNGIYPDHRDLKIKRLHKQVQDLEVSLTWKETESEEPVMDELTGDEEHPTNGDIIYESPPVYDEYGDEEWYSWFTGGDRNLPGDEFVMGKESIAGSQAVVAGGCEVAKVDHAFSLDDLNILQVSLKRLNIFGRNTTYPLKLKFQTMDKHGNSGDLLSVKKDGDPCKETLILENHKPRKMVMGSTNESHLSKVVIETNVSKKMDNVVSKDRVNVIIMDYVESINTIMDDLEPQNKYHHMGSQIITELKVVREIVLYPSDFTNEVVTIGDKMVKLSDHFMKNDHRVHGLKLYCYLVGAEFFEQVKSIENRRWFNAPFDPGGTCAKSGERAREVLFWRVVIITIQNRVDVPFDPGGFDLKTKLEDEFFRRRGV